MLNREERIVAASALLEASEEDVFAALGAAGLALGSPEELLGLVGAVEPASVDSVSERGFAGAASIAATPSLQQRGEQLFGDFLRDYADRLKHEVCAHYADFCEGKLDDSNLVSAIAGVISTLVVGTLWAPVVGILAVLMIKAALNMLCGVEPESA